MDQFIYQKLVESEPLGFIDPFEDLGTFDSVLMKFVEPVERLVNKYSGKPYNSYWQAKIKEMRELYIEYLESSQTHNEQLNYRLRNDEAKKHADEIVTTYLKLGFRFKEIEEKVKLPIKRLRSKWRRSDYVNKIRWKNSPLCGLIALWISDFRLEIWYNGTNKWREDDDSKTRTC